MIQVSFLRFGYGTGNFQLNIPDLFIGAGEAVALIGNNGAGKSTFLRLLLDLAKPGSGEVYIERYPVAAEQFWKTFTGAYLDEFSLIDFLTAEEYWTFINSLHRGTRQMLEEQLRLFAHFMAEEEWSGNKFIRDYSNGNQQKIGIIGALLTTPRLIVLDEPFAHLDPSSQHELLALLSQCKQAGATILLSSHHLHQAGAIADRFLLMDRGTLLIDQQNSPETRDAITEYFNKERKPMVDERH